MRRRERVTDYAAIENALAGVGLLARGGFHPILEDAVPPLPDGRKAACLVLAGDAGGAMWSGFAHSRRRGIRNPLDAWTREVLRGVAAEVGGHALFPFDPPYLPFQRWAQRAEPVSPLPIGILIHPRFGLWHSYRGAIAFAARLALPPREDLPSPCASCSARPCLSACPVGAFVPGGYDVNACASHVGAPEGKDCHGLGCRARRACPIGVDYAYQPEQAAFHMAAFLRAHRDSEWPPQPMPPWPSPMKR